MNESTMQRIFEPFFSTKGLANGTGLGLATVYGIVKSHGGHIACSSTVDVGTTFRIYLPAIEEPVRPAASGRPVKAAGGTETILFVDDEEAIRTVGRTMLENSGYTVLTAADGESALEVFRRERGRVDLVLLDLIMPGMGGQRCLERLLELDPEVKVIVASGYSDSRPMKETLEAGAVEFIGKPYEMKKILRLIRDVLDAV